MQTDRIYNCGIAPGYCILHCLLLHIEDQNRSKVLVIDYLDYHEYLELLITRPEASRPIIEHTWRVIHMIHSNITTPRLRYSTQIHNIFFYHYASTTNSHVDVARYNDSIHIARLVIIKIMVSMHGCGRLEGSSTSAVRGPLGRE